MSGIWEARQVVALPDGRTYILSREEEAGLVHTSLQQVVDWWAPWEGVDLVLVTTESTPDR